MRYWRSSGMISCSQWRPLFVVACSFWRILFCTLLITRNSKRNDRNTLTSQDSRNSARSWFVGVKWLRRNVEVQTLCDSELRVSGPQSRYTNTITNPKRRYDGQKYIWFLLAGLCCRLRCLCLADVRQHVVRMWWSTRLRLCTIVLYSDCRTYSKQFLLARWLPQLIREVNMRINAVRSVNAVSPVAHSNSGVFL